MPGFRTSLIVAGLTMAVGSVAVAANRNVHTMNVALPDGSVAHVQYVGKVAPTVRVSAAADAAAAGEDGFASFDKVFAAMEQQQAAMMQRAEAMQQAALADANHVEAAMKAGNITRTELPGGMVLMSSNGGKPAGQFSYRYVAVTKDAGGCTQRVEYSSDEAGAKPQVTRTSAGPCDAAQRGLVQPLAPTPTPPAVPSPLATTGKAV